MRTLGTYSVLLLLEVAADSGMFNVAPYPSYATPPSAVTEVHVVHSNHLDVGFNQRSWNDDPEHGGGSRCNGSAYSPSGLRCDPLAYRVINENFNVYFPRAAAMAAKFRQLGRNESFSYMTHSWLVSLFLDCEKAGINNWMDAHGNYNTSASAHDGQSLLECPNATSIAAFKSAIGRGDIFFHAFPHNANIATYDLSLLESSLNISSDAARYICK